KNPFATSESDGYVITDSLRAYIEASLPLEDLLMGFKFGNVLINLDKYPQYNIKVRPFYATLLILDLLHGDDIPEVPFKLLAAAVSCRNDESRIEAAAATINPYIEIDGNRWPPNLPPEFGREAARFSLSQRAFLQGADLIEVTSVGKDIMVRLTEAGSQLLS